MDNIATAIDYFKNGFNCSQAILTTYCEKYGLDQTSALKITTGFGGGMACMAQTCGAVTGAFMVIGLKYGKFKKDDIEAKEKTYAKIREFKKRFIELNGSIICKELLKCDINTIKGMEEAKENEYFDLKCPKFIRNTIRILEKIC